MDTITIRRKKYKYIPLVVQDIKSPDSRRDIVKFDKSIIFERHGVGEDLRGMRLGPRDREIKYLKMASKHPDLPPGLEKKRIGKV